MPSFIHTRIRRILGAKIVSGVKIKFGSINELIPFNLLYNDGMIDLIAPNYQNFIGFQKAIEEICSKKKNFNGIFKYLEK